MSTGQQKLPKAPWEIFFSGVGDLVSIRQDHTGGDFCIFGAVYVRFTIGTVQWKNRTLEVAGRGRFTIQLGVPLFCPRWPRSLVTV